MDPAIGRPAPTRLFSAKRARGADGAHGAEQQLPFRMAVEASALCEMEEALRVCEASPNIKWETNRMGAMFLALCSSITAKPCRFDRGSLYEAVSTGCAVEKRRTLALSCPLFAFGFLSSKLRSDKNKNAHPNCRHVHALRWSSRR